MGERVVLALLHIFPAGFRRLHGEEVVQAFRLERDRRRRSGSWPVAFWLRTLGDLCLTVVRAWSARVGGLIGPRHREPRQGPRAFLGGSLTVDLAHVLRRLARRPGFALIAAATLGLGMGFTIAAFSVVGGMSWRAFPVEGSEDIIVVMRARGPNARGWLTVHDYLDLRERQTVLEELAGFGLARVRLSDDVDRPQTVPAVRLTVNAFDLLRVRPVLGRGFVPADESADVPEVAVISHGLWRERYAADPGITAKSIRVNGTPTPIVGVMPEGFVFPNWERIWLPFKLDRTAQPRGQGSPLFSFGRLRSGVDIREARAELELLGEQLAQEYPDTDGDYTVVVDTFADVLSPPFLSAALLTFVSAALLLLLACANVSNLLLARAVAARRELAVRAALGAGRWRLVRLVLLDALAIAVIGTVIGLAVATWIFSALGAAVELRRAPWWWAGGMHASTVLFGLPLLAATALIASVVPALQVSRTAVSETLKNQSCGGSGLRIGRASRTLVVVQIAIACALLAGTGLLTRSIGNLYDLDLDIGLEPESLLTGYIWLPPDDYPDDRALEQFWAGLLESLRANPETADAALSTNLPITGVNVRGNTSFRLEDASGEPGEDTNNARLAWVSDRFFDLIGVPVVRGRSFSATDHAGSPPVALINRSLARRYFGEADPLGRRLVLSSGWIDRQGELAISDEGPTLTVVGVVPDTHVRFPTVPLTADIIYRPLAQSPPRLMYVVVRRPYDPLAAAPLIRGQVAQMDENLPVDQLRSLRDVVIDFNWFLRGFNSIFAVFGAAALVLAVVGSYGIMSFSVRQRMSELGIRVALGAAPGDIVRLILRQGLGRTALGLALGLPAAFVVGRLMASYLFRVEPTDPWNLASIVAVLMVTGTLASWIPARRAGRVDPALTMRAE